MTRYFFQSMTSTKRFSTKNAGILIVAIFSIAISIGLSQVSSALAQTDSTDCTIDVGNEYIDSNVNDASSCDNEDEAENSDESDSNQVSVKSSSNNDDNDDADAGKESETNDTLGTKPQSVASSGPASASPEDNIIKPINLNKGLVSDKPLKINNENNNQDKEIETVKVIEDEFELKQQLGKTSDVSEIYKSFDLPYTALYKNP